MTRYLIGAGFRPATWTAEVAAADVDAALRLAIERNGGASDLQANSSVMAWAVPVAETAPAPGR